MLTHARLVTLALIVAGGCASSSSSKPETAPTGAADQGQAGEAPAPSPSPSPSGEGTTGGTPQGGSSTAARLVADIEAWDKTVVVQQAGPGKGLGGTEMLVDGKAIWPPQGPGCPEYISCCEGYLGTDTVSNSMRMACQFAVAKGGGCPGAMETIRTIAQEEGNPMPGSCQPR